MEGNVLLGVTGSIAAYKAVELLRHLTRAGLGVQVFLTDGGARFVPAPTFEALAGRPVVQTWDGSASGIGHVEIGYDADAIVIAPVTAHTLARLAAGMADCPLTATVLSSRAPLILAPAMESRMWTHPATEANVRTLQDRGAVIVGPEVGPLASGRQGRGRMSEPEAVAQAVMQALAAAKGATSFERGPGRLVLTAGPTWEPIDPVRILTNRSTGALGVALADAAAARGFEVVLVSGPTHLRPVDPRVRWVGVESAQQMKSSVLEHLPGARVFVGAAAVSDYRPVEPRAEKLKRGTEGADRLELVENPDILQSVCRSEDRPPFVVGFAAETERVEEHAEAKRLRKGADAIVANRVGEAAGFGEVTTELIWIDDAGAVSSGPVSKRDGAVFVLDRIVDRIREQQG